MILKWHQIKSSEGWMKTIGLTEVNITESGVLRGSKLIIIQQ